MSNRAPDADFHPPALASSAVPVEPASFDPMSSPSAFRHAMELSQFLAQSQLLPQAFRGKPADVFMAMVLAKRMNEDVFTILQNVHFVGNKPGWSAPFLIARANASGVFSEQLSWTSEGEGPTLAVTCAATLAKTGQRVSKTASMKMARAEGWTRNSKYEALGEQMLSYRSAVLLIRLYAPSILFGLHTDDEWEDVAASRGQRVAEPVATYEDPSPSLASPSRPASQPAAARAPSAVRDPASKGRTEAPGTRAPSSPASVASPPDEGHRQGDPSSSGQGQRTAAREKTADSGLDDSPSAPEPHALDTATTGRPQESGVVPDALREAGASVAAPAGETRAARAKREAIERRREESEADRAYRQAQQHPSWKKARPGFCKELDLLGLDLDVVSAFCEYRDANRKPNGKRCPRPSRRDQAERDKLIALLKTPDGMAAFRGWADAPAEGLPPATNPNPEGAS